VKERNVDKDMNGLIAVMGAALLLTTGAAFMVAQGRGRESKSEGGKSFEAVKPVSEGTPRPCFTCRQTGKVTCYGCRGKGKVLVIVIGGPGGGEQLCGVCGGSDLERCGWCKGTGTITSASPGVLKWGGKKK
jgi:hypothetical protein